MNNKVKSLNLLNTSFDNPHGLHSENHYTTAYDLARIASYAMKNDVFKEICCTKKYNLEGSINDQKVFFNKNKLLSTFDGANGIKTGYTKDAGKCLVSSAERDGTQLICVVLDSYNIWVDSMNLLDRAFEQFKRSTSSEVSMEVYKKLVNIFASLGSDLLEKFGSTNIVSILQTNEKIPSNKIVKAVEEALKNKNNKTKQDLVEDVEEQLKFYLNK